MTAEHLELLASAFEKSAAYQEALIEENTALSASLSTQKEADEKKDTDELMQVLAIHGDTPLQEEVRDKLASADPALRSWVKELVNKNASTSLGRSVPNSNGGSQSSYEDDPEEAMLEWIMGD